MVKTKVKMILEHLSSHGASTVAEISDAIGVDRGVVKATVRKMFLDGRLSKSARTELVYGVGDKEPKNPVITLSGKEIEFMRRMFKLFGMNRVARAVGLAKGTCSKLANGDIVSGKVAMAVRAIIEGGVDRVKAGVEAQGAVKAVRAPRKAVQGVVEGSEGAGGIFATGSGDSGVGGDVESRPAPGGEGSEAASHRERAKRPKRQSAERDAKAEDLLRAIAASEKPMRLSEVAVALGKKSRDASSYFKVAEELVYKGKLAKDPSVTPSTYSISYATDTTRNSVTVMGVRFSVEVVDRKIYKEVVLTAEGQPRMSRACHDGNIDATTEMLVDSIKRRMVQL